MIVPALLLSSAANHAQVITDGTLGPRQSLQGPNFVVPPLIGRTSGQNLFHSFSTLNINAGATLTFLGGSQIANIISRVTGGNPSVIDGQIRSASPGVNLFLLNPSGIFFGPNASLNVAASFYASTANNLLFADGGRFPTTETEVISGAFLPFSAPSGFGFSGRTGAITLTGSLLVVQGGNSMGLFGGDVKLSNSGNRLSILSVLGGTSSVAAAGGDVDFSLDGRVTRGAALGRVDVVGGTIIAVNENATGNGGGRVVIRGGDVFLEGAQILANSRLGNGREIDIGAEGTLSMKGAKLQSLTTGRGNAGRITISAGDILMENVSVVDTSCDPGCTTGNGGDIDIRARRNLVMTNDPKAGAQFIGSNSFGGGSTGRVNVAAQNMMLSGASSIQAVALSSGASKGLTISADSISLMDGAQVDTSSRGSGAGGPLRVTAKDILIQGDRLDGESLPEEKAQLGRLSIPSGFFSNAYSSGNAGSVQISAGNVRVVDGGEISSSAARSSTGNGGSISISATGEVLVTGRSTKGDLKRSAIVSNTFSTGDGGTIEIVADRLRVDDQGLIQTQSEGSGIAGEIRLSGRDMEVLGGQVSSDARAFGRGGSIDIRLSGMLTVARSDPNQFAGIFARAYSAGAGGSISVRARNAVLRDSGEINAGTIGAGLGGNVSLFLVERLVLESGGAIRTNSDSIADAGNISINAGSNVELAKGQILTSAKLADGGNIAISAGGQLKVNDDSLISAEVKSGQGRGGNVSANVGSFLLTGSKVTASAVGGSGGNVAISASGAFAATDGQITAQVTSGTQNGGNVSLSGGMFSALRTFVSANAFAGAGGSIAVRSTGSILLDRSVFTADVGFGAGDGGNVSVKGATVMVRDTLLSANAFAGTGGSIAIESSDAMTVERSGITATVAADEGAGGNIDLKAGTLQLRDSLVSSSALSGAGGSVRATTSGSMTLERTRVSADVQSGTGSGGNVRLGGAAIAVLASNVSANTFGGAGGSLSLDSSGPLFIDRSIASAFVSGALGSGGNIAAKAGNILLRESVVSASALSGGGGNVVVDSSNAATLEASRVTAEVLTGLGDGGNLDIVGTGLVLRNATVSANAYGGRGGNIRIDSGNLLSNSASKVTASSQLGIDGTVVFTSPAADLSGALFSINSSFLDASAVMAASCVVPRSEGRSRFLVREINIDQTDPARYLFPLRAMASSAQWETFDSGVRTALR